MSFITFDPQKGLLMNVVIDSTASISKRMKTLHQQRYRLSTLRNNCILNCISHDCLTIEKKNNCYIIRVEYVSINRCYTKFRKQYHGSEIPTLISMLDYWLKNNEIDMLGSVVLFANVNNEFIASYVIHLFEQVRNFIDERNGKLNREIIQESLSPKRLQRMFDCGLQDIEDLFLL